MKKLIVVCLMFIAFTVGRAFAAEAPAPVPQDYKQLFFQEQAMRGSLLAELGKLIQENAMLKQRVDALQAAMDGDAKAQKSLSKNKETEKPQ